MQLSSLLSFALGGLAMMLRTYPYRVEYLGLKWKLGVQLISLSPNVLSSVSMETLERLAG